MDIEGNPIGVNSAQTNGNNTFTGDNTFTGSLTTEVQTLIEQATPANPSLGSVKFYAKNDSQVYSLDSTGTETQLGGSSILASANTFTGANTFTQPISGATPIAGTDLATKDYTDSLIATGLLNWAQYGDTQYTTGARLTLSAGVKVPLPNNALNNITSYMPSGVAFYDSGTQKITPQSIGETYELRVNFMAESASINNFVDITLDIGGTQGIILDRTFTFPRGSGVEHSFSSTNVLFSLDTFVANGGALYIEPDANCDVWDIQYLIVRTAAGNIDLADAPNDGNSYSRLNGTWSNSLTDSAGNSVVGVYDNIGGQTTNRMLGGSYSTLAGAGGNTSYGLNSLDAMTIGDSNTAVGSNAAPAITEGVSNTVVGASSMLLNETGNWNTFIGCDVNPGAGDNPTGFNNRIGIGYGCTPDTNRCCVIGTEETGKSISCIKVGQGGICNLGLSNRQFKNLYLSEGVIGDASLNLEVANRSIEFVDSTGVFGPTATSNTIDLGSSSQPFKGLWCNSALNGSALVIGGESVVGAFVGKGGVNNYLLGSDYNAITTGIDNTAYGYTALNLIEDGVGNTAYGTQSLKSVSTGYDNTGIGGFSGQLLTTGFQNVVIGASAGGTLTTGDSNTIIGPSADVTASDSQYRIAIGYAASCGNDNQCVIGGSNATTELTNIKPGSDQVCDLGSSGFRFKDIYLSGTIIGRPWTNVVPATDVRLAAATQTMKYKLIDDTTIQITGFLYYDNVIGRTPSDFILTNLPAECRPTNNAYSNGIYFGANTTSVNGVSVAKLKPDGNLTLTTTSGGFINNNDAIVIDATFYCG